MVEKTTQFSLAKIRSILFNLPNLFFLLILATFRFPSKYALEMDEKLKSPSVFIAVLVLIEIAFLFNVRKAKNEKTAKGIFSVVFIFLFLWELLVSRLNLFPYVFVPAPENVFYVFIRDTRNILKGFASSMQLLALGMGFALFFAVTLGTIVGWFPAASKIVYPISKAVSTVPPLIYTPYVVLIMPTFKIASLIVIFLSIFWGVFMGSINNTLFVEKKIINSAKSLSLSTPTILFKIIIPFNFPRILNNLPINLATAIMTLTAAEMLGAESGMGFYVRYALAFADYTKAIAGIIFIGLVVTIINELINLVKKRLVKWSY